MSTDTLVIFRNVKIMFNTFLSAVLFFWAATVALSFRIMNKSSEPCLSEAIRFSRQSVRWWGVRLWEWAGAACGNHLPNICGHGADRGLGNRPGGEDCTGVDTAPLPRCKSLHISWLMTHYTHNHLKPPRNFRKSKATLLINVDHLEFFCRMLTRTEWINLHHCNDAMHLIL